MDEKADVIIIGAGLAGLTAALHLAERGLRPLVLEAAPRVGGRLAGGEEISINGTNFRLEHGVHGIWAQYRNLNAMLARHNLRPVFVPANDETWIYRRHGQVKMANVGWHIRNSAIPAPFHYLQLFADPRFLWMLDIRDWMHLLHVTTGLTWALGVDPYGENQPLEGMTLEWLTRNWSPALKALFLGLARNALAAEPDLVPLSGFIAFLRFYTLLRRDAWGFSYLPEDGGAAITEPLAARVEALGGSIRLNTPVTRLEGSWTVYSGEKSFRAPHIILAVESQTAKHLLESSGFSLPASYFPLSTENAIARLWFSTQPQRGAEAGIFSGEFTGHNFFWLDRIYNPFRRWARETGGSAIEVHVYGPPETLAQPDAVLLAQVAQEVGSTWPELRGARLGQHLQRNPATHTLPAIGRADQHLGTVTPWDGLFCAGDWIRHPTPALFLERATVTGISAANAVLQARGLDAWALVPHLPPEPFAAWLEGLMRRGREKRRSERNKNGS